MASKSQERKDKLRDKLIDAAQAQIIAGGLQSVKARDLARAAGCSLGAIYNAFEDMNALVMQVNGRTFRELGEAVAASVLGAQGAGPNERLIVMSNAYLAYAAANTHRWRALFDLEMSVDGPVPDWYLTALGRLFANIAAPLAEIFPDMAPRELDLMTRALFSSVHGIVLLGLEKRISGVPFESIEMMIAQVLSQIGNK
ncbi:MAG: AcrR family transcriptional regulator [Halocynthiibacter sp.]|jgi:AcrR family transcriptional regulator